MSDATPTHGDDPDGRHRSFHLTRPRAALAADAGPNVASGWVRIICSDGTAMSLRVATIDRIVGPAQIDGRWVVNLVSGSFTTEPIGFTDQDDANQFIDDLTHEE